MNTHRTTLAMWVAIFGSGAFVWLYAGPEWSKTYRDRLKEQARHQQEVFGTFEKKASEESTKPH